MFPLIGIFNRLYFNPRSHERSDLKRCKYMRYKIISIHAPTRGATFSLNEVLRCPDISIHAPTRGATVPASASHSSVVFQSTLPREERPGSFPAAVGLMLHFNPRSHERSDPFRFLSLTLFCISIHAPTRGATSSTCYSTTDHINFNPRSHERSDANRVIVFFNSILFQSTLPREERLIRL